MPTDDAIRFRRLAAQARAEAEVMTADEAKRLLLRIAAAYDALAERAERTGRGRA